MVLGLLFTGILLTLAVILLLLKIKILQTSADEIAHAFSDRISTQTNTLIDLSTRDRHMMVLAETINVQLRHLRAARQRYTLGDAELKAAVSNIAHDLRTPLTATSGYLQLLDQEPCGERVRHYLDLINNRTDAMKLLTEELFRYSVLTSQTDLSLEPLCLNSVLEESLVACFDALTQRGITPDIHMPETKVERLAEHSSLSRIFENILQNAVKYSDGDLKVTMTKEGRITFSNTASALDTVSVGKLFDRFYTVESGRNSTGLGLSIAKLLTERMGGSIRADYFQNKLVICICFDT